MEPTIEQFEAAKVGHRVSFMPKEAVVGPGGARKRQYGYVDLIDEAHQTAQIGPYIVPLKALQRFESDVHREWKREHTKYEREQVYGKMDRKTRKQIQECAKDARAASLEMCLGGWTGPLNKEVLSRAKHCREAKMIQSGIMEFDDRAQCAALPLFLEQALRAGKPLPLKTVEYLSGETGLSEGDRITLGGKRYTVHHSAQGEVTLKNGRSYTIPFDYVPHDVKTPVLPEERKKKEIVRTCFEVCVGRDARGRFAPLALAIASNRGRRRRAVRGIGRNRRRRQKRALGYAAMLARITKSRQGREALKRYRKFWGIKYPPSIRRIEIPGPGTGVVLVGMGKSPALNIADGPKGQAKRKIRRRHRGIVACDASGKRMFILSGRNSRQRKQKLKMLGYVPVTEYIPSAAIERKGSFKKGKHWVHKHDDDGGRWPKAFMDQAGNIIYGRGTYRVGKWIER